ncbi:MAG: DUF3196 domain-containing protein [Solobacterium sp.]|nr:DUF3196 domain-containing protein [Solobacterium sp.]MCH4222433.1 DUF3196 domain-containing protein [Solobacterium sp.]MCH4265293.1 DUF3196 domain-containing protein [Solobacterium sp.]
MAGYYDEVIEEIRTAINDGKLEDASYLLKKELSMPYIPEEVEPQLRALMRDLAYAKSEKTKEDHEESLDTLLHKLKGRPQTQLGAAESLSERNLRVCINEIKDYLGKDPQPEAAALLIEAIAEQEIGEEFILIRDGLEFTFWGDALTPVIKSEGFLKAVRLLDSWYEKEPDLKEMARTLVIHDAYLYLPLSYEADEALPLAEKTAKQVSDMMDGGASYQKILDRLKQEETDRKTRS